MKARTLAPVHPSRLRMYLMFFKIYPRVSEDHLDRSWMLQMGSLSPVIKPNLVLTEVYFLTLVPMDTEAQALIQILKSILDYRT